MSKFVICVSTLCLMVASLLMAIDGSPLPDPAPIVTDMERLEGPIGPAVPIRPQPSEIHVIEVAAEPSSVRLQRSLLNGRFKSHHHHHHGGHYRPHGHYGGGEEYHHGHGGHGGHGGGSFAGASAFSGSQGGYGGHGAGAGASASSNSISFQTPFGGVSASQAYASSYGRGRDRYEPW